MAIWNFSGQTVVITGGGGGFGVALIEQFVAAGAHVYACGRSESILKLGKEQELEQGLGLGLGLKQKQELKCTGSLHSSVVDVSEPAQVQDWIQSIIAERQRVDVLVNAAGVCPVVAIEDTDAAMWDHIIGVNLKGTFLPTQAVIAQMKQQGYGRIINFSSIAAFTGGSIVSAAYAASKGGIISLTKALAISLSPHGVTVNCIAPGPTETEMIASFSPQLMERLIQSTPNRRLGVTADITHTVMFLADPGSSHITGATIDVNGGLFMR